MADFTVTIINGNSDPTFVGTKQLTLADLAVISPTGITTPHTPYAEWVADTTALLDGSVAIPAWKRSGTQYFVLPAASKVVFTVKETCVDEVLFYRNMIGKFENVTITVSADPVTDYVLVLTTKTLELTTKTESDPIIDADKTTTGKTTKCVSSVPAVATVTDAGAITAVADGTTTITVTATWTVNGVTLTDVKTCEVTVKLAS